MSARAIVAAAAALAGCAQPSLVFNVEASACNLFVDEIEGILVNQSTDEQGWFQVPLGGIASGASGHLVVDEFVESVRVHRGDDCWLLVGAVDVDDGPLCVGDLRFSCTRAIRGEDAGTVTLAPVPLCGNGWCSPTEDAANCPSDCP